MSAGGRGRGRRGGGGHEEEHVNHERWLVSYSDMITVLMALFIVLYAISQVDQDKYVALKASLAAGFGDGSVNQSVLDGSDGTMDGLSASEDAPDAGSSGMVDADEGLGMQASDPAPQTSPDQVTVDASTLAAAQAEAAHLEQVREQITAALNTQGLADAVRFRVDERGLVLGLVADDVFFAQGSATLTPTADQVLDLAAPILVGLQEQISVEGHANTVPISGRYPTNWELSSDRATQVLRHLVEYDGMPGSRIQAVGYGDTRPLVEGTSPEALIANRRVDMVILSVAPEAVRALLPSVAADDQTGG